MKRIALLAVLAAFLAATTPVVAEMVTTLNKNDPAPLWSTYFPLDFLLAGRKAYYKGHMCEHYPETFSLAITPFHQKASRGRNFDKQRVPIGDIEGRWHMLGLLYGQLPPNVNLNNTQLGNAKVAVFSDLPPNGATPNTIIDQNSNEQFLFRDPCERVGFFSVPIRYRKTGLRFQLELSPFFDFGITVRGGVCEIKQTVTGFHDLIPTKTTVCCQVPECPVPTSRDATTFVNCCPANIDEARIPSEFKTLIPTVTTLEPPTTMCPTTTGCIPRYQAIEEQLMDPCKANRIFREMCQDPCDFRDTSIEDVYISFWFRHAFKINAGSVNCLFKNGTHNGGCSSCGETDVYICDGICTTCGSAQGCTHNGSHSGKSCGESLPNPSNPCTDPCSINDYCADYTCFLFIPFASFNVALPTGKKKDRTQLLSLPFGNDGHTGLGFDAGFDLDFYETVEFGIEAGFMSWNCRKIEAEGATPTPTQPLQPLATRWVKGFRLPTQEKQSGIFPFATTVKRTPGTNWHFSAVIRAYRFLCNLSGFAQYMFVSHGQDCLEIPNPETNDPNGIFKPKLAECLSKFEAQLFNTGLNYEISDNFSVGFAVQWPVAQRNAYRSTTYLGTLRMIF